MAAEAGAGTWGAGPFLEAPTPYPHSLSEEVPGSCLGQVQVGWSDLE